MPGPLDGLRVIDVGTRIGAPFCAGLLGEWGAEVVKVEQPRPRRLHAHHRALRRRLFAVLGRGGPGPQERHLRSAHARRPRPLPPAGGDGRRGVRELPPRHHGGLGIGPGALDPRLVFVRISAFGQDGPYAQRPASTGWAWPTAACST